MACRTGSICENEVINACYRGGKGAGCRRAGGAFSDGGVHSSNEHLYALIKHAVQRASAMCAHCVHGRRDVPPERQATCSSCRTSSPRTDSKTPCAWQGFGPLLRNGSRQALGPCRQGVRGRRARFCRRPIPSPYGGGTMPRSPMSSSVPWRFDDRSPSMGTPSCSSISARSRP